MEDFDFKSRLSDQEEKILQMCYDGKSLQDITDAVRFKTGSVINKRMLKNAGTHEDFVTEEYDKFLDNCID